MSHRRGKWATLALVFYTYLVFMYSFQAVPPILPFLMVEFDVSHVEAGLLMSVVAFPGILFPLIIGVLVARFNLRLFGLLATVLMALGTFTIGWAGSFIQALVGRTVLGASGAIASSIIPVIISRKFSRGEISKAMGIYNVNVPVAIVLALFSVSFLAVAYGWRLPLQLCFILSLTTIPLFLFIAEEGHLYGGGFPLKALKNVDMWLVGILWLLFNSAIVSFITWGPKIYSDAGLTITEASLTIALVMVSAAPLTPIYGWLLDKFKAYRAMALLGSATSALILAILSAAPAGLLPLITALLGVTIAMVPPIIFTSPNWILKPHEVGIGFGIITLCLNIGAALGPPLIGLILDLYKLQGQALLAIAAIMASSALIPLLFGKAFTPLIRR